jgi:serine protease
MKKNFSRNMISAALVLMASNANALHIEEDKNRYIVTLDMPSVLADESQARASYHQLIADSISKQTGVEVVNVFYDAIQGFVVDATNQQLKLLEGNKHIKKIIKDTDFTPQKAFFNDWGISRIDQRETGFDTTYQPYNNGQGVVAYILDTGVDLYNSHFDGLFRSNGFSANDGSLNGNDCDGHGTSVASLVSSEKFGVAKKTQLVPVSIYKNVPECETDRENADLSALEEVHLSKVLDAIDFIQQDAQSHDLPSIVNISFTWWAEGPRAGEYDLGDIELMEEALQSIINSGVTVIAGAGNDQHDACWNSPARMADVITVGAIAKDDHVALYEEQMNSSPTMTSYSNYGQCVDIFAPGTGVSAASVRFNSTSFTGTSAASPFVTGAAALALSDDPYLTPAQVKQKLINDSTKDVIVGLDNLPLQTHNRLLYVGSEAGNGGGTPPSCDTDPSLCPQPGQTIVLIDDQAVSANGEAQSETLYSIEVTSVFDELKIATQGGSGDLDIMVKFNSEARLNDYDCRSQNSGNDETCIIDKPQIGTYYINAYGYSKYNGSQIIASLSDHVVIPPAEDGVLQNGDSLNNLASISQMQHYTITVPASQTLNVDIENGTGDVDLYVKAGSQASKSDFDCRPFNIGNNESCSLTNSSTTDITYHIMLNPYKAYSGVTLTASY